MHKCNGNTSVIIKKLNKDICQVDFYIGIKYFDVYLLLAINWL